MKLSQNTTIANLTKALGSPSPFDAENGIRYYYWDNGFGGYIIFQPVTGGDTVEIYDDAYYDKYIAMSSNEMGRAINATRQSLVALNGMNEADTVDIGIGAGAFIADTHRFGYDVNPKAIEILQRNGKWHDIYAEQTKFATFWDSIEHIEDPALTLYRVTHAIMASVPVLESGTGTVSEVFEDLLRWKHHRVDEHLWYFVGEVAFESFLFYNGFQTTWCGSPETSLGRESIYTYHATRRKK